MTSRGFSENSRGSTVLMDSADDRRREHDGAFQRIGGNPQQSALMRPDLLEAARVASSLGCYKGVGRSANESADLPKNTTVFSPTSTLCSIFGLRK